MHRIPLILIAQKLPQRLPFFLVPFRVYLSIEYRTKNSIPSHLAYMLIYRTLCVLIHCIVD